ncbi:MAG TPA: hypothetical protein VH684_06610 [Xanthobacteraceae bacterium]|jgi:hypothetical protein
MNDARLNELDGCQKVWDKKHEVWQAIRFGSQDNHPDAQRANRPVKTGAASDQ